MIDQKVVTYLKQKIDDTWDVSYIGSSPQYIKSTKNSSVNNLEEALMIGTDTCTVKYETTDEKGDPLIIIEKSYKSNDKSIPVDGYYKIVTNIYDEETVQNSEFYFYDDGVPGIFLTDVDGETAKFGDSHSPEFPDDNTVYFLNPNIIVEVGDNEVLISPPNAVTIRKDELYYMTNNDATATKIIEKITTKGYSLDYKEITKENIINPNL